MRTVLPELRRLVPAYVYVLSIKGTLDAGECRTIVSLK
jgi:hypothetical protein